MQHIQVHLTTITINKAVAVILKFSSIFLFWEIKEIYKTFSICPKHSNMNSKILLTWQFYLKIGGYSSPSNVGNTGLYASNNNRA